MAGPSRRRSGRRTEPSLWRLRLLPCALLVAIAFGVYLNALDNPFVYDDFFTVTGNPSIAPFADPRWTVVYMPFRPVVNVSYALDRVLWSYAPLGYHLTSIVLHAVAAVLLFTWLCCLLDDAEPAVPAGDESRRLRRWAAFVGAAVFAVHPVQSETAGYISARSEILCAVFLLGALLLTRRAKGVGWAVPPSTTRRLLAAGGALACAVFAMLSKEVAAALPVLVVAYDWLVLPGAISSKRRRLAVVFVPLAVLTVAALAYRVQSLAGIDAGVAREPLFNLLTQAIVIWRYLAMLVVPVGQSIMHATHTVTSLADPLGLAAAAGLIALVALAWWLRRYSSLYAFGVLWWFACIAPSSSVIVLKEAMAEHRVYVASAGLAIVLAAACLRLLERVARRSSGSAVVIPAWCAGAVALVLVVLGGLTIRRNTVWDDPVQVWREALAASPGMWEPHYALADALRESGDCTQALPQYEAALAVRDKHRELLTNYGICLGQLDRYPEAETAFRRALAVDPAYARGYTNLAAVALLEGDAEQARDYYQRAIVVDPRNVHARMQLARIYEERLQDYARAARLCEEARVISPSTPGATECVTRNEQLSRARSGGARP